MRFSKKEAYRTRCPIHGTIRFNEREKQIIDHPFCQRLRHISQLGFSSYVYTGATHNRLGHTLGVMHIAGRLFEHTISEASDWISELFTAEELDYFLQVVRFAALLHDIGHAPFSHSSEAILPLRRAVPLPTKWYKTALDLDQQASHEDFSIAIIYALSQEEKPILSEAEAQDICSLIDAKIQVSPEFTQRCELERSNARNPHPLMRNIISGEVDADRMDYLHRDSHYAGVNYGKFDLDRLIQTLSCVSSEDGIRLALDSNALYTYENFLISRIHMFLQVYFHRTAIPFDYFLQKSLTEKEVDLEITGDLHNYLFLRDDSVLSALSSAREQTWASRIVYRRPMKFLFSSGANHQHQLFDILSEKLQQAGIFSLTLSTDSPVRKTVNQHSSLLIRQRILGNTKYTPVHKVSFLLEKYEEIPYVQNLYCEPEDYDFSCKVLWPTLEKAFSHSI